MIKIYIQGMEDGIRDVDMDVPVEEAPGIYPEFFGLIEINGQLRKIGDRFSFTGEAQCSAELKCDRSLKDYEEMIQAEIKISFLAGNMHEHTQEELENKENENTIIIGDEDKEIDITDIITEELSVNLPLKRIAPEYRDKEFDEIYPEYSADKNEKNESNEIDDRWSALKDVKINSLNN